MTELQQVDLVSVREGARSLSISVWTVRAHIKRGDIAIVRCGRRVLISRAEIVRIAREGLPSLTITKVTGFPGEGEASDE